MLKNTIMNSLFLSAILFVTVLADKSVAISKKPEKSETYYHNEAENKVPYKCTTDMDCDGLSKCNKSKTCQGTARKVSKTVDYRHNEANNQMGANRCQSDNDCDGLRVCSPFNWCHGTARRVEPQPIFDSIPYAHMKPRIAPTTRVRKSEPLT